MIAPDLQWSTGDLVTDIGQHIVADDNSTTNGENDIFHHGAVPMYYYFCTAGGHFMTDKFAELGGGIAQWQYEGIPYRVCPDQEPGTVPLYRYVNPAANRHFYTTNYAELGAGKYGYYLEEIQCYVFPTNRAGTLPLHRYSNPASGDHYIHDDVGGHELQRLQTRRDPMLRLAAQ